MNARKFSLVIATAMMAAGSLAQAAQDNNLLDEITIRVFDNDKLTEQVFDILLPRPGEELPAPVDSGDAEVVDGKNELTGKENHKESNGRGKNGDRGRNASADADNRRGNGRDKAAEAVVQGSEAAADASENGAASAADASENAAAAAASASEDARNASEHANENSRNNPSRNAPGRNKQ